ncbi:GIY-YIG nuclease family protein [Alcanivorax marinus]|nr:GIY-YIG nuclease family protein [Alloalcanivorax marinus]MBL7251521.1 GIY-YIG nuclease family protein [Alloalcanivorax marinus]
MLRCADGSLYTGVTTDVLRRWNEHNDGPRGARYTRARRPVALVLCVEVPDRARAGRLEARLKALPRARKERLIRAVTAGASRPVANGAGNCLTADTSKQETLT